MKTAISLDDRLLAEADQTARQMGLSRSRLFCVALKDFLARRREEEMLKKLNSVYGSDADPSERRILAKMKSKFRGTVKDRW